MAENAPSKGTPLAFKIGNKRGIGGFSAQNRIPSVIFYLWIPIRIQVSGLPLLYPAQGKPATPRIHARPPAASRFPLRLSSPVPRVHYARAAEKREATGSRFGRVIFQPLVDPPGMDRGCHRGECAGVAGIFCLLGQAAPDGGRHGWEARLGGWRAFGAGRSPRPARPYIKYR